MTSTESSNFAQVVNEKLVDARSGKGTLFAKLDVTKITDFSDSCKVEYRCIYILHSSLNKEDLNLKKSGFAQAIERHIAEFHSCNSAYELVHDITCGYALSIIDALGLQVIEEEPNIFCIYVVF